MFGRGKSEGKFGRFGQTFLPFAMLNLHKKRPVAVLGETRPVDPDKGCVGEVLGAEYFLPKQLQRPRVEATFTVTLYLYERLQRSPLQNVDPSDRCSVSRILSIKINDRLSYFWGVFFNVRFPQHRFCDMIITGLA